MTAPAPTAFVRAQMMAPAAPPRLRANPLAWIGGHLFNSVGNVILTLLGMMLVGALAWPTLRFLLLDAVWRGSERTDCLAETVGHEVGACWPFIAAKFDQLMYGFYFGRTPRYTRRFFGQPSRQLPLDVRAHQSTG